MADDKDNKNSNKITIEKFEKSVRDKVTKKTKYVKIYDDIENDTREFVENNNAVAENNRIYMDIRDLEKEEDMQFIAMLVLKYGITDLNITSLQLTTDGINNYFDIQNKYLIKILKDSSCKIRGLCLGPRSSGGKLLKTENYRPIIKALQSYKKLNYYSLTNVAIDFIMIIEYFLMVFVNNIKNIRSTHLAIDKTVSEASVKKYTDKLISYICNKEYNSIVIEWSIRIKETARWLMESILLGILYSKTGFSKINIKIKSWDYRATHNEKEEMKQKIDKLVDQVKKKYKHAEILIVIH